MNNVLEVQEKEINILFKDIKTLVVTSRNKVYQTVNIEMLNLYWNIGKKIMEIQKGEIRANYGEEVLEKISRKLTNEFGKGFSIINLRRMRKFYLLFPIRSTVLNELIWSHYLELIKIEEEPKRSFYLKECINAKWSVRELQRQKDSLLYERLLLSSNKEKVMALSKNGHEIKTGKDLVKDPFVLEFLDIKENTEYLETDLEKNILSHLKELLSTTRNETVVKYTLPKENKNIFSSLYKLHLPTEEELIQMVEEERKNLELK